MRSKFLKVGAFLSGLLFCGALVGQAVVHAEGPHGGGRGGHGFFHHRMEAKLDEALDAAKVTPDQRQKIHAIRDRVVQSLKDQHKGGRAHMDEALRLFEADRIDAQAVARLRTEQEQRRKQSADVIQAALTEVHDLLLPEQRRALTEHVRGQTGRWFHPGE